MAAVVICLNLVDDDDDGERTFMPPDAIMTLQKSPRFKNLFDHLKFTTNERRVAMEVLLNIASRMRAECFAIETQANQAFLENNNMVTFTDEDTEVRHPEHKGPLYLVATINQTPIKISLVDTKAFMNLIQLSTLEVAEIPETKI